MHWTMGEGEGGGGQYNNIFIVVGLRLTCEINAAMSMV